MAFYTSLGRRRDCMGVPRGRRDRFGILRSPMSFKACGGFPASVMFLAFVPDQQQLIRISSVIDEERSIINERWQGDLLS